MEDARPLRFRIELVVKEKGQTGSWGHLCPCHCVREVSILT
jgi:hypothetical protein